MSTRRPKIAVCNAQIPFNYGGAEILAQELVDNLNDRGVDAVLVQLPFKWYPDTELINNTISWRLLDLTEVNGDRIDAVICTKFPTYAVKHPNKILWLVHQHRAAYDLLGTGLSDFDHMDVKSRDRIVGQLRNIDNHVIPECQQVFTISGNVANRLKEYNSIEAQVLYPPLRAKMTFWNEDYGDYVFVAGRLDPLKRYEVMIRAMQYVKSTARFVLAGTGKHGEALQALATELKVDDRVQFLGYVSNEELANLYAGSLAVFFAPFDEDYGFVTVEAMKSSKPVITLSDAGGANEFVKHGENGYVFPNTEDGPDYKAIAAAVDDLFDHRDQAAIMGGHGRETVEAISWDTVITSLLSAAGLES